MEFVIESKQAKKKCLLEILNGFSEISNTLKMMKMNPFKTRFDRPWLTLIRNELIRKFYKLKMYFNFF